MLPNAEKRLTASVVLGCPTTPVDERLNIDGLASCLYNDACLSVSESVSLCLFLFLCLCLPFLLTL